MLTHLRKRLGKNPLRTLRGRLAITYACLAMVGVATSALYTASTVRSGLHDRVVLDLADEARLLAFQIILNHAGRLSNA